MVLISNSVSYLGNKNQHNNCSCSNEKAETCDSSESVDLVLNSIVDNEDNYKHKAGEVSSHDNLPVVVQALNFHLSGF